MDRCLHELRTESANADKGALARLAVNGDATDSLQGFSQILIGKRTDVLRGNRVDKVVRISLSFQRLLEAAADAGHDDLFDDAGFVVCSLGVRLLSRRCTA